MKFRYASYKPQVASVDMTPMIDIVFNLLLFFLCSSSYVQHATIEIKLPEASNTVEMQGQPVTVDLTRTDVISVNGKRVNSIEELTDTLKAAYPPDSKKEKPLLIRADAFAFHGRVIAILDIARGIGVRTLNVETIPEDKTGRNPQPAARHP